MKSLSIDSFLTPEAISGLSKSLMYVVDLTAHLYLRMRPPFHVMKRSCRKVLGSDEGDIDCWARRLLYRLGGRVILQGLPIGTQS